MPVSPIAGHFGSLAPMGPIVVEAAAPLLPHGLAVLAEGADAEGIAIVSAVITRWADGTQRYDQSGESLLVARSDQTVVGVGGLTRCPHVPGAMRVRRFYVAAEWRRLGVARLLAERLIDQGFQHSNTLTCNARASAAAPPFWENMGFRPVATEGITHTRTLNDAG